MNSISWLIYIADITQGLSLFLGFSSLLIALSLVMLTFASYAGLLTRPKTRYYFLFIFISILANTLPSKTAIYMIAASEMGEKAINTELAGDVFFIIKKEIQKMKEKHQ